MLLILVLGELLGVLLLFAAVPMSSAGIHAMAYALYGRRAWRYSNRTAGFLLIGVSSVFLLLYAFFRHNFGVFFKWYLGLALLSLLLSDLLTIRHIRNQEKQTMTH